MKSGNQVIIIGAGIAGLTTAHALQKQGIDWVVFESVKEIKPLGAGITLAGNAMLELKKLGLDTEVLNRGHHLKSLNIVGECGELISYVDSDKLTQQYNLKTVAIHRAELQLILLSGLDQKKIITGKKAISFSQHDKGVEVYFEDGSSVEGTAVLAADGIHSAIRQQLIPESMPRYSGYSCWRGIVEDHWNLDKGVEMWGSAGRFGYVPLGDNKVYWYACVNQKPKIGLEYNAKQLVELFKDYAGPVTEMINRTRPVNILWNDIVDLKPLDQLAFGRVLLIGDAAHASTPNLGQGAALGIEDALMVSALLKEFGNPVEAFLDFQQKRMSRIHYIVNTSFSMGKVAQLENRFLMKIRNAIFRVLPDWINEIQLKRVLNLSHQKSE